MFSDSCDSRLTFSDSFDSKLFCLVTVCDSRLMFSYSCDSRLMFSDSCDSRLMFSYSCDSRLMFSDNCDSWLLCLVTVMTADCWLLTVVITTVCSSSLTIVTWIPVPGTARDCHNVTSQCHITDTDTGIEGDLYYRGPWRSVWWSEVSSRGLGQTLSDPSRVFLKACLVILLILLWF